jgi:hypothetical protein
MKGADLVVVNTCGFIDAAVEESLDAIGEALTENGKVIVTGCLGAREEVIRKAHPQVLAVTGPHAADEVLAACAYPPAAAARPLLQSAAAAGNQTDTAAFRLPEDFRGLQSQLHLLHHPVDAWPAGQPPDRRRAAGSEARLPTPVCGNCW